jgi:hypothetical protein
MREGGVALTKYPPLFGFCSSSASPLLELATSGSIPTVHDRWLI